MTGEADYMVELSRAGAATLGFFRSFRYHEVLVAGFHLDFVNRLSTELRTMPTTVETSAYVADVQTRYASGLQRFIRHHAVPEGAPPITWDHPETLSGICDQCKSEAATIGQDKLDELHRNEAPMPGEIPRDRVKVPGISDAS